MIGEEFISFLKISGFIPFSKYITYKVSKHRLLYSRFVLCLLIFVCVEQILDMAQKKIVDKEFYLAFFIGSINNFTYRLSCIFSTFIIHLRFNKISIILNDIQSRWLQLLSSVNTCKKSSLSIFLKLNFFLLEIILFSHQLISIYLKKHFIPIYSLIPEIMCFIMDQYILNSDYLFIILSLNIYYFFKLFNDSIVISENTRRNVLICNRGEDVKRIRRFYGEHLIVLDLMDDVQNCFSEVNLINILFSCGTTIYSLFLLARSIISGSPIDRSLSSITYVTYFYMNKSLCSLLMAWKIEIEEIVLLFCVLTNMSIAFAPLKNVLNQDGHLQNNIFIMHRYTEDLFKGSKSKLWKLYIFNLAILFSGFTVSIVFTCLEAFKFWKNYAVGKHHFIIDVASLSTGFLRVCMGVIYVNGHVMYNLVYGTCYSNINLSLSRYIKQSSAPDKRLTSVFRFKYLKHLEVFDNTLKDFYTEVIVDHTWFSVTVVVLSFLNWFYVIGYIFLNLSPLFNTYPAWVTYFSSAVLCILGGAVYADQEASRTSSLLHELYIDEDDVKIQEEVEILSLQLLHRQVEFDAGGFFKLDFSLLLSMFSTVTTYVLILLQFENPSEVVALEMYKPETVGPMKPMNYTTTPWGNFTF